MMIFSGLQFGEGSSIFDWLTSLQRTLKNKLYLKLYFGNLTGTICYFLERGGMLCLTI
jgi:hypothetical protein